jgi:AraC-like DNA-binding protein
MTGNPDHLSRHPGADSTPRSTGPDALSDVLRTVRLTGALFFEFEASSPWVTEVPASAQLARVLMPAAQAVISYHVVIEGAAWAALAGERPVRLEAGDVLVLPRGDAYVMSSAPGQRTEPDMAFFKSAAAGELPARIREGGGGADRMRALCGFLGSDLRPFNPLLGALPALLHVPSPRRPGGGDRLSHLVEFALTEASLDRAGGQCVLLRLSELMFVEIVRRYLTTLGVEHEGWLAGLRDPAVGQALALLHRRPGYPWTLEELSHEASISRSALAERFAHFVGEPPMRYLTRWRMQVAARLLADGSAKVAAVAGEVGYESEAAFSRAFKKVVGVPPSTWRRTSAVRHPA